MPKVTTEATVVSPDELEQDLILAYETRDFDFVSFALAYANPPIKICGHREISDPDAVDSRKNTQFIFFLSGTNGEDVTQELEAMALGYMNRELKIEPASLLNSRKQLRVWMLDHQKQSNARRRAQLNGRR